MTRCGAPFSAGRIRWRKRNGDNFTGYRFDHAASSSGEFQSRARTDSLISTPLKGSFSSESLELISFWFDAPVFMKQLCHLPRRTRSTRRICCFALRNSVISAGRKCYESRRKAMERSSGAIVQNASHSEAAKVMSGKTAMSCRGLRRRPAARFILVRFYGLRPLRSGWAALP